MVKLVIFDLDGVLFDSKDIHFDAFNNALSRISPKYKITKKEHLSIYDGLPTRSKLSKLHNAKKLPKKYFAEVWKSKQEETINLLQNRVKKDFELIKVFKKLRGQGFLIAVASNSIKSSVVLVLNQLGLFNLVDRFLSHEDVERPKPYPEIYWKCMIEFGAIPKNTVIIEDSNYGRQAAIDSKCHLIPVESRRDISIRFCDRVINLLNNEGTGAAKFYPWTQDNLNVLIPMAGLGSRFQSQGYSFPKPLIDIRGRPMIEVVVQSLNIRANYIFIVQKEHYEKYNLKYLLRLIAPHCKIIQVNKITEGAACTTLLAKKLINNNEPLLIVNSDQFLNWNSSEIMYSFQNDNIDGGIVTFQSSHPKWSYAKIGQDGYIKEVAEKKPISRNATAGIYFWKKGKDYVRFAEKMINKNIRVNNEFYVCPVFNEAILEGKKFKISKIDKSDMWGIGTPEDLNYFLENYKNIKTL
jgi:HAD superfamily hydrolase (TIGR01509 family)